MSLTPGRGLPWDELSRGQEFVGRGRTITEHDVGAFAGLSGDFNPLHMDAEAGRNSVFGERVPHGPLGVLFAMGASDRLGILDGVGLAFLEMRWHFHAPMRIGDTISVRFVVDDLRETKHPDRGVVVFRVDLCNQEDELVQQGWETFLVRRGAVGRESARAE